MEAGADGPLPADGAQRIPRAIPDGWFDKLFASLPSDRDRALVAFWISTGGQGRGSRRACGSATSGPASS